MRFAYCAVAIVSIGGCANVNSLSITDGISVADISDRIQCDLKAAYAANSAIYPWLEHWAASFEITIKQQDQASLKPSLEYSLLTNPFRFFGFKAGLSAVGTGTRTLTTKRTVLLKNLLKYNCSNPGGTYLANALHILEPMRDALSARDEQDAIEKEPDSVGYRIDFIVKTGLNANPSFVLYRIPGVGAEFSLEREKTQTLDIAFSNATPASPQKVFVTNWPSTRSPNVRAPSGMPAPSYRSAPSLTPEVRQNLNNTLQNLKLENLLQRR